MEKCVRPAILKDCIDLAPKMRLADRREIKASDNLSPLKALVLPFTYEGARNYTILGTKEEGVIGMFGTTPCEFEDGYGVAWMLSSDLLRNHVRQFLKECPYWVAQMGQGYKYLYNFVDERNWETLKWLQFLGFEPKKKLPYGHEKLNFILVMKELK